MTDAPDAHPDDANHHSSASADAVAEVQSFAQDLQAQAGRAVVGQTEVVEQLLICLLTRGHAVLEGVPGLAKTLLVSTIAKAMQLEFSRIQFTPDLMPSDITGTEVIEEDKATGERRLRFVRGPVFANVILADEINRTPPKTQAALLEAMQEGQVTAGGQDMALPQPFFVLATQNPIEQEGTYPLPEAQLDRFLFQIRVGYPSETEELEIVRRTTGRDKPDIQPVVDPERVLRAQDRVRDIPVADSTIRYALALVRATRAPEPGVDDARPDFVQQYLAWGAGPRASQGLILAGKAHAALRGRAFVNEDDLRAVARPVLRHRLLVNFAAEADGVSTDDLIERLIQHTDAGATPSAEAQAVLR
ncbi:MAG: MoxR family ATPase [Planctomycetota bacterium]